MSTPSLNYQDHQNKGLSPIKSLKQLVANLSRQQRKINDLLGDIGYALRSFQNINQFLELIPLMITRLTDAHSGGIILFKQNGQLQQQQIYCGDCPSCGLLRKNIELTISEVVNEYQPEKVGLSDSFWEKLEQYLYHNLGDDIQFFGSSIVLSTGARGRLYVFINDAKYEWNNDRQKLLQLLADQTAVAIANDELTIELRKKERLDRELEIGAEIQERLLPRTCPEIPNLDIATRYQTAHRVGGDYYDFIPANYDQIPNNFHDHFNKKWSIVIGDVMGKGVPAGLIMTMTRGMLRAEVLNGHSPARILHHLNRVMYPDLENSNRFVTLFYSEYDPQTRILTYSNGAHNPPLLWQAETDKITPLDTKGMLIGIDPDSAYEEDQIQLAQGDTLLYYTDGLTDAINQNNQRFEEDNLIDGLRWACHNCDSALAIVNHLFSEVKNFVGNTEHHGDDMTMVVIKVN